jgi:hypothetical protein
LIVTADEVCMGIIPGPKQGDCGDNQNDGFGHNILSVFTILISFIDS